MAYIGKSPSQGVRNRFQYQATAGQDSFSGSDANGLTLTYTDSLYMDVYQNGILLVPGDDYTATTGTTVVLVQSASLDDIIEMVVYDVFSVPDAVSQSAGGTFSGNVTMGGTLGVTGVPTFTGRSVHSGGITIANDGQIGSVGDADAMAISSSGVVTFSQTPVGAGGLVLLQTVTASDDATVTVGSSSLFTTDYKIYQIHCINIHPVTDSQEFRCRMSKGGSVISANYEYARFQHVQSSSPGTNRGSNSDDHVNLAESIGADANEHICQVHTLYNPAETTFRKIVNFYSASVDVTPNFANNVGVYAHEGDNAAIDGIQFFFASGNISTGTFKLYGIA